MKSGWMRLVGSMSFSEIRRISSSNLLRLMGCGRLGSECPLPYVLNRPVLDNVYTSTEGRAGAVDTEESSMGMERNETNETHS